MKTTTLKVDGMTIEITDASRGESLRSVFFTLPNVEGGLHFELTSFRGNAVEVYRRNAEGIYMYMGTVRDYFPSEGGQAWFRAAWYREQPSKAARTAFERSATARSSELAP